MVTVSIPFENTGSKPTKGALNMGAENILLLDRLIFTDLSTIGTLYIGSDMFCKTLELSCRKENAQGKMAIPMGKYRLSINPAVTTDKEKKFGFTVIQVHDVPGRENIEIHPGNTCNDTTGCILTGFRSDIDTVYDSRNAFFKLKSEVTKLLDLGSVYLQIAGER